MRGREKIAKWCILLLLFLFSSFTSPFLFLSSLTFNSLFWLPWLLCPLVLSAVINSMGTVPIYTQIKSMWFLPLTPLLHQPLLFAAGIYHARRVPTTFWPLARALSLSLYLSFTTNFLLFWAKRSLPLVPLSLSLWIVRPLLIPFVLTL